MKTDSLQVGLVLQDSRRFTVPIFQRQYAWRDERLEPFWADVVAKAEEALDGRPRFMHYLGALILAPGADGYSVGRAPSVQVVDGQQRLTTFQLFLSALRDVARRHAHADLHKDLEVYIRNSRNNGSESTAPPHKLIPTPADREIFAELMLLSSDDIRSRHDDWFFKNGRARKASTPAAIWAYSRFLSWIEGFALHGRHDEEDDPTSTAEASEAERGTRLQALADSLLLHMKVVIITLEEGDDAQVIFETLNSRGEPLLAMDLVRNNIFHRAEALGESADELFASLWSRFDTAFWKEVPSRAKPQKPRVDFFLGHALTAQTGSEVSVRELYAEYRAFIKPKGGPRFPSVEAELRALVRYVPSYETLERHEAATPLDTLGRRLAVWEVTTAYPLAMCIAVSNAEPDEKAVLYELVYSYIVRRAVCALTPKSLNKTFQRVATHMLRDGVSRGTFARAFHDQSGPAVRFPDDEEFTNALTNNGLYQQFPGKMTRLMDVLWELEIASRTKFQVDQQRPDGLSVEHVMPQRWEEHWPLPDGTHASVDRTGLNEVQLSVATNRDRALHTLGNLTLVTVPLNPSLSNGDLASKQGRLAETLLAMNTPFSRESKWDIDAIGRRAKALKALALKIWPACPAPAPT